MNIYSISMALQSKTVQPAKQNNSFYYPLPRFTAQDSFNRQSITERNMNNLKSKIDIIVSPFGEKYKNQFNLLGMIGYETQEKCDLVKELETQLIYKKVQASDNKTFKQFQKNIADYEKYIKNKKDFEHYVNLVENSPFYSTTDILKTIEVNRKKFFEGVDEFNKLKPYYDTLVSTKGIMAEELDNINFKNVPEFAEKIEKLNTLYMHTVMFFMTSGYTDMAHIYKEYQTILNEKENRAMPGYKLPEKINRLELNIEEFDSTKDERENRMREINQFLSKNRNYKTEYISADEIKTVYKQLNTDIDRIIAKHTDYLKQYDKNYNIKTDKKLIREILAYQEHVNAKLASLIQKEKEKIYQKSSEEFNNYYMNVRE